MGNLGVSQIDSVRVEQQKQEKTRQTKAKQENVSFFDEAWSGHQIAKLTGDNSFTDWLQGNDKVCKDGKDDGKLSFKEGAWSFVKGLIGGIPKTMINHPVSTLVTVGVCAGLTALTGGAILPVLGAVGVAAGVGMIGFGAYKTAIAKTDGEAKQALETMGMGTATTVLSALSADKALKKASEAGVKSARVAEDANIFKKTAQMFKATPESLTKSKEWTLSYIKGTPVNIELENGTKQVKVKGKLKEETFENGAYKKYDSKGNVIEEILPDGTHCIKHKYTKYNYVKGNFTEITYPDGTYVIIDESTGLVFEKKFTDGTIEAYYSRYDGMEGRLTVRKSENGSNVILDRNSGKIIKGKIIEGNKTSTYEDGKLVSIEEKGSKGVYKTSTYKDGKLVSVKKELPNRNYKLYDADGVCIEEKIIEGNKSSIYKNGNLKEEWYATKDVIDTDPKCITGNSSYREVTRYSHKEYYDNGKIMRESFEDGYLVKKYNENGDLIMSSIGDRTVRYENGKPVSLPYSGYDVAEHEKRVVFLTKIL